MFRTDNWQEIFFTIKKNKLRTVLTAMGVFWGILILMLLLGSGRGMENGILSMYGDRVINSIYFWAVPTTLPFQGKDVGRKIELDLADAKLLQEKFNEKIKYMVPRLSLGKKVITANGVSGAYTVRGETRDYFNVEEVEVLSGRLLNEMDQKKRRKVILIGKYLKEVFFEDTPAVGNYLTINGSKYKIIGVYNSKNANNQRGGSRTIFLPLSTSQDIAGNTSRIDQMICALHPTVSALKVEKKMKTWLKRKYEIHPDDRQGIRTKNMAREFKQFQSLFTAVNLFVWFVGLGTLFAGIVSVGNIMLITVKERIKEIGIRKALGATPGSIISSILMESVFITTISGYAGLIAGAATIFIVSFVLENFNLNSRFFANPEIDFEMGLSALGILILAGLIAGFIPALKASLVNPVIALRNE